MSVAVESRVTPAAGVCHVALPLASEVKTWLAVPDPVVTCKAGVVTLPVKVGLAREALEVTVLLAAIILSTLAVPFRVGLG